MLKQFEINCLNPSLCVGHFPKLNALYACFKNYRYREVDFEKHSNIQYFIRDQPVEPFEDVKDLDINEIKIDAKTEDWEWDDLPNITMAFLLRICDDVDKPFTKELQEELRKFKNVERLEFRLYNGDGGFGSVPKPAILENLLQSFEFLPMKTLKITDECSSNGYHAWIKKVLVLCTKYYQGVERIILETRNGLRNDDYSDYQDEIFQWMSSFKNLRKIEIRNFMYWGVNVLPPSNMMYLIKEVHISAEQIEPFNTKFFKGCVEKMPNLEIWMFELKEWETHLRLAVYDTPQNILKFLKKCQCLKSVLHTKKLKFRSKYCHRFEKWLSEYSPFAPKTYTRIMSQCCEIINQDFPIDTTEISVEFYGMDEKCTKRYGEPAILENDFREMYLRK